MGTRNLTCVVVDGEMKVAQYGQWDGYPSGQGKAVLEFLTSGFDKAEFIEKVRQTRFIEEDEHRALWEEIDPGNDTGFVGMDKANEFKDKYPQLDRDMAADVLQFIMDSDAGIVLKDDNAFAYDGLFCEWAYVVDFDTNRLEVYNGFGKEPLEEAERFFGPVDDNGYAPIRIVGYYDLDNLPDAETFVKEMEVSDDDDEDTLAKDDIYAVIDHIRSGDHGNDLLTDRICNYMEANIDEFIETYE